MSGTVQTRPEGMRRQSDPPSNIKVDWLQHHLGKLPSAEMPLVHTFTPGLYARQATMPAGSVVVSRVHRVEHPFIVSKGRVSVWNEKGERTEIQAPYMGVTKPGTRRVLLIHEETVWTTFHATNEKDIAKLEDELTYTPDVRYTKDMEFQDLDRVTVTDRLVAEIMACNKGVLK